MRIMITYAKCVPSGVITASSVARLPLCSKWERVTVALELEVLLSQKKDLHPLGCRVLYPAGSADPTALTEPVATG